MGGFFGGKAKQPSNAPNLTGVPFQTSAYGVVITIAYGLTRLGTNIIDYDGFQAIAQQQQGGGKGGIFGGKGGGVTYNYTADMLFALCEGPIAGVGAVWQNQTITSMAALGLSLFLGGYAQAPWSYWSTKYGSNRALSYSGVAYLGAGPYQLGQSQQVPNNNFEVGGQLYGTCSSNQVDADPTLIAVDLLTNPYYGGYFPASRIGTTVLTGETSVLTSSQTITVSQSAAFLDNKSVSDTLGNLYTCVAASPGPLQYTVSAGVYTFNAAAVGRTINIYYSFIATMFQHSSFCRSNGIGFSPAYTSQQQLSRMLEEIATNTYSYWVWSQGVLTLVPRAVMTTSGYGYTFTPPQQPVVDLSDDDFVQNQGSGSLGSSASDPVIVNRTRPANQNNHIKVECLDRTKQYATAIVEQTDQALVDRYGKRSQGSSTVHMICDVNIGYIVAQYLLQSEYTRNIYTFTTDARYAVLDVMDVVTLSQTSATLPLNRQWVRIIDITENNDGTFTFVAEEYPTGTGAAAQYTLNRGQGKIPDFNVDPGFVNPPIMYVPPMELTNAPNPEIMIALSGFSPNWAGCEVWVATSQGGPYTYVGTQLGATRMGWTTIALASHADPDAADTLGVDLTESRGTLSTATQLDADLFNTLCFVGGPAELISYQSATLTAANKYTLGTYMRRGAFNTPKAAHLTSSAFFRMDNQVFILPIDRNQMNTTFYVKFLSFNIYGAHKQLLSDVTPYSFVPAGNPALTAVTNFKASPALRAIALSWTNPPQRAFSGVQLFRNTTNAFATAALVAELGNAISAFTDSSGLAPGGTYYYWIRPEDLSGNFGPVTGPVSAVTLQTASADYGAQSIPSAAYVPGSIGSSPLAAGAVSTNVAVQQPSTSWVNFPAGNFSGYTFYQLINTSFSLDQASYVTILFFAGTTPYFNPTGNAVSPNLQIVQVDGSYVIGAPIPSNPTFYGAPCIGGASTIQVFLGAGTHTLIWWVQPLGMGSSIYDIVYGTNCTVIALKR